MVGIGMKPTVKLALAKDESALIKSAIDGDKDAFRVLVEPLVEGLLKTATRIVGDEAQDILQEGLVKAYLNLRNFKGNSSFKTWIYRIIFNLSIDYTRKNRKEDLNESALNLVKEENNPERITQAKEELFRVQKGLQQLSQEHREVLLLREVDGFSYEEISEITGVSQGTVMSRLFYARQSLIGILDKGTI
jgi:RNA polymerase sigma-70 factor (ECF subfamily)